MTAMTHPTIAGNYAFPAGLYISHESTTARLANIRADLFTADTKAAHGDYLGERGALAYYRQVATGYRSLDVALSQGATPPQQWTQGRA